MERFRQVRENLEKHDFRTSCFETAGEAVSYLREKLHGRSIGFGGSSSILQIGLYDALAADNRINWQWLGDPRRDSALTEVFICSANAVSETGEIVNIDGTGDRVASTLFGHDELYFIVGRNKLEPTLEDAIRRARNVAAPKNAERYGSKTPCLAAHKCLDCKSPERLCRTMNILFRKTYGIGTAEIILIDEDLGF